jgi:hypothetical protein
MITSWNAETGELTCVFGPADMSTRGDATFINMGKSKNKPSLRIMSSDDHVFFCGVGKDGSSYLQVAVNDRSKTTTGTKATPSL